MVPAIALAPCQSGNDECGSCVDLLPLHGGQLVAGSMSWVSVFLFVWCSEFKEKWDYVTGRSLKECCALSFALRALGGPPVLVCLVAIRNKVLCFHSTYLLPGRIPYMVLILHYISVVINS